MRLTYAARFPEFTWTCCRCGKTECTTNTEPMVDFDGPAFKAYYHSFCAMLAEFDYKKETGKDAEYVANECPNVYYFPGDMEN